MLLAWTIKSYLKCEFIGNWLCCMGPVLQTLPVYRLGCMGPVRQTLPVLRKAARDRVDR